MHDHNRKVWIEALALGFFAAVLLLELFVGMRTGEAVNWLERAIFWAIVAVLWAFFMEWFLRRFVARQAAANGLR